jgi:hypothetical protein
MASSNNSVITGKFRGTLGKELVFREWEGKTVVAKAPKRRQGGGTPGQEETKENFLLASRYANLYSRAMEDFLSPPVVKIVDTSNYTGVTGSQIQIRAVDDFRVTGLQVEIHSANGTLLEKGNAVQLTNGLDWTYTATQANNPLTGSKIKATATDVPGNKGILEVTL